VDFLSDPRPQRAFDPETAEWGSEYFNEDLELRKGMISLIALCLQ